MRNKISKSTDKKSLNSLGKRKQTSEKHCCDICQKTIRGNSYKFKCHLFQHKAVEAAYKCPYCSMEFFRNDIYSRHLNKHTGNVVKKEYICDHCDRSFCEKRNLIIHLKVHTDFQTFTYKCMACGVTYCEERLLKYHIRKTHYNLHLQETNHVSKALMNETWVERVKESEVCVQMTKVNNNMISIKKFGTLQNETVPAATETNVKVKFKEYINSVLAQNDKSQYSRAKCDYCNKEMLKKSLLPHIRERHLKLRKFKCDECKRSFSRHYLLVDHKCGKVRRRRVKKELVSNKKELVIMSNVPKATSSII